MHSTHRNHRNHALGATAVGLALALTACGGGSTGTAARPSATEHNATDVAFASDMLQHHAQALSMVDLTRGRVLDPEVRALATDIRAAQAPEIATFASWLDDWDEPVPAMGHDHAGAVHDDASGPREGTEGMGGMGGMGHSDRGMPGMMSGDDMRSLARVPDARFQAMWLDMMIEHHAGALDMAETEIDDGRFEPARGLAGDIVASQTDEIETMRGLLD